MADVEYVMTVFAVMFSAMFALVIALIGSAQYATVTNPSLFDGFTAFFSTDGMSGWAKTLYTIVMVSPMLTVGGMISLNYIRGR